MGETQTNKEALFNEVKGSLFEYLTARKISQLSQGELTFQNSLDPNYLNVLSQQDRMVRQFYPELLSFLNEVSDIAVKEFVHYLGETPHSPKLRGKFESENEADIVIESSKGIIPLSLKLNKKNAFVNTKSGGVKSFFETYFDFIEPSVQLNFNKLIDFEFSRMSYELHALNDLEFKGDYHLWIKSGKSELPGELNEAERRILKDYYARMASQLHEILSTALKSDPQKFYQALPSLMGFSHPAILQLVCFHDFKSKSESSISIHSFKDLQSDLNTADILPFKNTSSVEISLGDWTLQIRIKPMNKFTTTAIKINCSVKFKQCGSSEPE